MTIALTIRRLSVHDAADFRAIRLEGLKDAPSAFGASYEENVARPLAEFADRLGPPPDTVFGVFDAEGLVGMAGFMVEKGHKERHKGYMWGVFVRPSHREKGVGKLLVAHVLDYARGHVEILRASVVATNATAAGLYLRLGFAVYGVEPRALKIDGRYFDEQLIAVEF